MTAITFITHDGAEVTVESPEGQSLMLAAVNNDVSGIEGQCGGEMACGTCHVYVDSDWEDRMPPIADEEDEMLDALVIQREPNSRLGCQVKTTNDLDGLRLTVVGE